MNNKSDDGGGEELVDRVMDLPKGEKKLIKKTSPGDSTLKHRKKKKKLHSASSSSSDSDKEEYYEEDGG